MTFSIEVEPLVVTEPLRSVCVLLSVLCAPAAEPGSILASVNLLPPKYRAGIYLHYYEGYTLREIARLLGVTVPTVKMRLKRGRDALRNTWEESL